MDTNTNMTREQWRAMLARIDEQGLDDDEAASALHRAIVEAAEAATE